MIATVVMAAAATDTAGNPPQKFYVANQMSRIFANPRRAMCLLLVAAALMMRALLPGGTMIGEDRSGDLVVTICNSDTMLVIPMKDVPASDAADDQPQPCAFVSLADNSTPPDPLARPALPHVAEAVWNATRTRALSPASPHYLPPATGPPLSV